MNANLIALSLLGILGIYLGYFSWISYTHEPTKHIFPWGQETGKTHHIQSKTHDTSLYIELKRRQAIQGSGRLDKTKIKETRTKTGSTTGAIELMLSAICPPICCPKYDTIYDGGNEVSEYCPLEDKGGGAPLDAGNDKTNACGVVCPGDTLFDGGTAGSEYCPLQDNGGGPPLDAGNDKTNACGVCPPDTLFDGGTAGSEYCPLQDNGGGPALDAGNDKTNACSVVCPGDTLFDGGTAGSEHCPLDDNGTGPALDAGNENTKACGI